MKIAINVCTMPARAAVCRELLDQLCLHKGDATTTLKVYCDDPPSGGSWNNYRRVLSEAGSGGEDWTVSLDDDALLCWRFRQELEAALEAAPGDFVSFYCSNKNLIGRAREAHGDGLSWVATFRVVHGIAWAIRPALAPEVLRVAEAIVRPDYYSGDQRLGAWLAVTKRPNYIAMPNLVDHRPDLTSTLKEGRRNDEKGSAWFKSQPPRGAIFFDERSSPARVARNLALRGALREGFEERRASVAAGEVVFSNRITAKKAHDGWTR